jgi:extracellular matrix regulatory protein A
MASRVIAIVAPGAAPMKRLRDEAAKHNKLVDSTQGRRTRSIILMDSDHVILSAINPETIAARFAAEESEALEPTQAGEAGGQRGEAERSRKGVL